MKTHNIDVDDSDPDEYSIFDDESVFETCFEGWDMTKQGV